MSVLKVTDLKKRFPVTGGVFKRVTNWVHACNGVSLEINEGETLGLVGESGSGKSTLGRLIMRLIEADSGSVLFEGTELAGLSFKEMIRHRKRMQMIFQDPMDSLNARMTIEQIVLEPLDVTESIQGEARQARIEELLHLVGLPKEAKHRYPHEFSGGQRQRIGIARALALSPKLIIADEPVSALDVSIQAQVLNLIKDLQERFSISFLFIAHDIHVIQFISHRIAVMYLGEIVETGPTEALRDSPKHPYTLGLWTSVPELDPNKRQSFQPLQGEVPSLTNLPTGCGFHPRCPHAGELCKAEKPELEGLSEKGHSVACHWVMGRL